MKLNLHRQDVQWLRHHLRSNFKCVVCIVLLSLIIRYQPNAPLLSTRAATPTATAQTDDPSSDLGQRTPLPPESELELITKRRPHPVAPTGWRRTNRGWEHVSTWPVISRQSISELVADQVNREPAWIRSVFTRLRGIPPLMVALLQVTGIAVIIGVARDRRIRA